MPKINPRDKSKPKGQTDKRAAEQVLSLPERYYIESHGNLSIEDLARDLSKPIELVRAYCLDYLEKNPPKKTYKAKELMHRPSKNGGVIAMTEAASMVADDCQGNVTLDSIRRAQDAGDFEHAKNLKKMFDEQETKNKNILKNKYSGVIHYIEKPHPDAEVY